MRSLVHFLWLFVTLNICLADDAQLNKKRFPSNFLFGAATSAYQVEGAWIEDGKSENIWDNITHKYPEFIADGKSADISCNSYHKYKEDVALLKDLGVRHYRFSLAWSRILPNGYADQINEAGVQYYKNLIRELKANQIEPMVTIYHRDLPQCLQDLGGVVNRSFPDWFADYARTCFRLFGDDVKYWLTLNEPYVACTTTEFPPLPLKNGVEDYICAEMYLKAHAAAWHIYDEEFRATQRGKISIVLNSDWIEPESNSTEDVTAAETKRQFMLGWYAHPLYQGDWPDIVKTRVDARSKAEGFKASRLPVLSAEDVAFLKGTNDFFALNAYSSLIAKAIPEKEIVPLTPDREGDVGVATYRREEWPGSASSWLKVVPWGMRNLLKWIKEEYSDPEIIITENGYSDHTGQLADNIRINFIRDYLSNVRDAMDKDEVKVIAYTLWSLIDNFEFSQGFTVKFGVTRVDFDSPNRTRTKKDSFRYYEKVCKTHCLVDDCEE
ncbi:hypothetical protein JTB14_012985 [Gonioctena quinquepunctata]|nr:hypothetical protein JTB14_012985 [Gonioctena quinquepunctata]